MKTKEKVLHPIPPLYDERSKILILGSFPSVKSRETGFFYGHPQNRFWKVIASICEEEVPQSIEEKKELLYHHGIALWDVIGECRIKGSADASIEDVKINDLNVILRNADIRQIFVNGKTAEKMYLRHAEAIYQRKAICLPSTSPANATFNLDKLIEAWSVLKEYL
ncbi:MAG: DNA-deoxyinosine glycosylase [Erysipelotrichaceae bacterium]|nr:DNA-deoxyinosine glycosylase [Erysipelotrichaceae bacterium]